MPKDTPVNLSHSVPGTMRRYWLDMVKFFERMMLPDQELVEVNYYSAVPLDDQQAADNQDVLFSANLVNPKFKLHLGRYKKKNFKCQNCGFKNNCILAEFRRNFSAF